MVEVKCEWCKNIFLARRSRVLAGQSRFCSLPHYKEWLKSKGSQRKNIGKENAIVQWEKSKNMFCAYWYDDKMKYHSAGWGRWYWEINLGEVPQGKRVGYKDGNSKNNTPENLKLKSWDEYGKELGDRVRGVRKSEESKKKMSKSHQGKVLSKEHRLHIGDATRKKWNDGLFDSIHKGENNHHWRGGVKYTDYPKEFHKIKSFVRERDKNMCQVCGKSVYRSRHGHVHHFDGNKKENVMENLILVCTTCHGKIHSQNPAPPPILAFRSKLEWNKL